MRTFTFLVALFATFLVDAAAIDAQNATTFSLLYGYPLLSWQQLFYPVVDDLGSNKWDHNRQFSNADNKEVVKPNVDTLYSALIYDLTAHDLVVTVPYVPEQDFKLFSFFDPYSVNYANIGTGGFYKSGKYLLRACEQCNGSASIGLSNATSAGYSGVVTAPGPYGLVLARWGVTPSLNAVHQRQNASDITLLPKASAPGSAAAPLTELQGVYNASADAAVNVLNMLAYFAPSDVPSATFSAAGVDVLHHTYTPVDSVDLVEANTTALEQIQIANMGPEGAVAINNDWTMPSPAKIGVFGSDYALRAAICIKDYLALRNPYATYPEHHNKTAESPEAETRLIVGASEAVILTFSGRPPVKGPAGFWSLTIYNEDLHPISNDRDVYALGDRSNLTYPNGVPVYPLGHSTNTNGGGNGTFQILIQPADVTPPANWTSNWLPAPSGGGQITPQLRFYSAEQPLLDGSYVYPVVEKRDALVGVPPATGGGSIAWIPSFWLAGTAAAILATVIVL